MLLINSFKKASVTSTAPRDSVDLMLFLYRQMKIFTIFCFLLFTSFPIASQNLDSLLTAAEKTKNDSIIIRMYNRVGSAYIFRDPNKALQILKKGTRMAEDKNFSFGLIELVNSYGIYMDVTGKSDSANFYFSKALDMSREHHFKKIEIMCINNLGMFHWNRNEHSEALKYFFDALKMNDEIGTERESAVYLNNIGLIYQEMGLYEKALNYHQKALKIREKYNLKEDLAVSLNNVGIDLKYLGRIDEAIAVYERAVKVSQETENRVEYYRVLHNLGNVYQIKGETEKAIEAYLRAIDKPKDFEADEKANIHVYSSLSTLYNRQNNADNGLFYAKKGFDLIKKYPHLEQAASELYLSAAESHYMLNDFSKAREMTQKFITIKDSIFSEQNAKAVADLEIKYDTEKKEKQILVQRAELAEKNLTIQKQNYQLYGLIGLALIFGLIGYLFYNQQKLKNKQLLKENELKDALIKIETQSKLQEQRLRISRDLHDNIGAQLTFIISSIDNLKYGFDIKDDKLNKKLTHISEFTSSTIYELRDTIWAMNKSEITFEDLQSRISNYIDKAHVFEDKIDFSFTVSNEVDTSRKAFTSVEGMNIHRVIQEAIQNSLKHSSATEIKVNVLERYQKLIFKIIDNGRGFDVDAAPLGNGIVNMKKRIHEIGGELTIVSDSTGTIVSISLPS